METEQFKARLLRDGYREILEKEMPAGESMDEHTHPFDVRLLVLEGGATIQCSGEAQAVSIGVGDVYELAANVPHTEKYSSDGYRFLLGKREPAG